MTRQTDPKQASSKSSGDSSDASADLIQRQRRDPSPHSGADMDLPSIERRTFLKTGTLAGAAALAGATDASRAQSTDSATAEQGATTPIMTAQDEAMPPADVQVMSADERAGSDYMVDVFKSLDFEYFCSNPAQASADCTSR